MNKLGEGEGQPNLTQEDCNELRDKLSSVILDEKFDLLCNLSFDEFFVVTEENSGTKFKGRAITFFTEILQLKTPLEILAIPDDELGKCRNMGVGTIKYINDVLSYYGIPKKFEVKNIRIPFELDSNPLELPIDQFLPKGPPYSERRTAAIVFLMCNNILTASQLYKLPSDYFEGTKIGKGALEYINRQFEEYEIKKKFSYKKITWRNMI